MLFVVVHCVYFKKKSETQFVEKQIYNLDSITPCKTFNISD